MITIIIMLMNTILTWRDNQVSFLSLFTDIIQKKDASINKSPYSRLQVADKIEPVSLSLQFGMSYPLLYNLKILRCFELFFYFM